MSGLASMGTATKIEDVAPISRNIFGPVVSGEKAIYKLSTPVTLTSRDLSSDHVYISTMCVHGIWETYMFLCDPSGHTLSWTELPGSIKGCWSHAEVLAAAGYQLLPSGPTSPNHEH